MDSFYGGKQGISFVIKARFSSIDDMMTAFKDPEYKSVWYGEYCLIDTENKFSPDNGKVYRRTLNTAGDPYSGYAEYVGQIVGPAGGVPKVILSNLDDIEAKHDTVTASDAVYYINQNNGVVTAHTVTDNLKVYKSTITAATTTAPAAGIVFKSGREYGTDVTPSLKYNWYNHTATTTPVDGFGNTALNIGLEIPYVDFRINDNIIELPYYVSPAVTELTSINNFYRDYQLSIPHGLPGAYVDNVQIVDYADNTYYEWPIYNEPEDDEVHGTWSADFYNHSGSYSGKILVCDFHYPTGEAPSQQSDNSWDSINGIYICDYKPIEEISLVGNIDGTRTGTSNKYIIPDNDSLQANRNIYITYNAGDTPTPIGSPINYIQDIVCTYDGHLCVLFSDPTIRQPTDISGDYGQGNDGFWWRKNTQTWDGTQFKYTNPELIYLNTWYKDYGSIIPNWGIYARIIAIESTQTAAEGIYNTGLTITSGDGNLIALTEFESMSAIATPTGSPKDQGWYEKIITNTSSNLYYYEASNAVTPAGGVTYYIPEDSKPLTTQYWIGNDRNNNWIQIAKYSGNPNYVTLNNDALSPKPSGDINLNINSISPIAVIPTPTWV